MLQTDTLYPMLDGIDINQSKRFADCPWCGRGSQKNSFVVTRKQTYYLLHCFRCNRTRRLNTKNLSLSNIRELHHRRGEPRGNDSQEVFKPHIQLPQDFTADISRDGLRWLSKYNISADERATYTIGFSPILNRVILPIFNEANELVYYQGRKLNHDPDSPKYINLRSSRHGKEYFRLFTDSKLVVIVEDILSAIAIRRTGYSAMALLGTYLPDEVAMSLPFNEVVIWLDPDKKKLSQQYAKRLRSFGKKSRAIVSHIKDPKEFSRNEITKFLYQNT